MTILLCAMVIILLLKLGINQQAINFLENPPSPEDPAGTARREQIKLVHNYTSLAQIGSSLAFAIVFFTWAFRANRNARALGARGLVYTPGWTVLWFLIPFANLYKPLQVFKEIWLASDPDLDLTGRITWKNQPIPRLLIIWWIPMLAVNLHNTPLFITMRPAVHNHDLIDPMISSLRYSQIHELIWASSLILTLIVVRRIQALQEKRHQGHFSTVVRDTFS